jgi:SEC-C motif-containing protein
MRSRYTAFARGNAAYLRLTWDPRTRPRRLELDPHQRFTGLEILGNTGGGLLDVEGTVEFRARHDGGVLHENSLFRKDAGRWVYVRALL